MRMGTSVVTVLVILVAGCGGSGDGAGPTDTADTAGATAAPIAAGEGTEPTSDDTAVEDEATGQVTSEPGETAAAPAAGIGATVVVDGVTREFPTVLDCTVGNDGAPDDRQFVGETADGSATFSMGYFGEGELSGLNTVDLEAVVDGQDWTYASSYAGSEGGFTANLRDDGADGAATVRAVGIGAPDEEWTMEWSFTC